MRLGKNQKQNLRSRTIVLDLDEHNSRDFLSPEPSFVARKGIILDLGLILGEILNPFPIHSRIQARISLASIIWWTWDISSRNNNINWSSFLDLGFLSLCIFSRNWLSLKHSGALLLVGKRKRDTAPCVCIAKQVRECWAGALRVIWATHCPGRLGKVS